MHARQVQGSMVPARAAMDGAVMLRAMTWTSSQSLLTRTTFSSFRSVCAMPTALCRWLATSTTCSMKPAACLKRTRCPPANASLHRAASARFEASLDVRYTKDRHVELPLLASYGVSYLVSFAQKQCLWVRNCTLHIVPSNAAVRSFCQYFASTLTAFGRSAGSIQWLGFMSLALIAPCT